MNETGSYKEDSWQTELKMVVVRPVTWVINNKKRHFVFIWGGWRVERANSWNSGKIFEARARANTMDLCKRSLMLKNSPPQDNFTERLYGVVSLKKHAQKNPKNMKIPFHTSFYWVYNKLHINFLGIWSISHLAIKPTALCPGSVLGPDFASPSFVRAKYQAGFSVDW